MLMDSISTDYRSLWEVQENDSMTTLTGCWHHKSKAADQKNINRELQKNQGMVKYLLCNEIMKLKNVNSLRVKYYNSNWQHTI